ncbi:hypothetical protein HAX54_044083 [Datura stramonium]|uniref:Uncharacterized protein n=1 Tax=Datura stramonium TaxID=4076 RepID=A0ABS8W3R1_DATST|nr:hypothetical protein [Datura stramonium]
MQTKPSKPCTRSRAKEFINFLLILATLRGLECACDEGMKLKNMLKWKYKAQEWKIEKRGYVCKEVILKLQALIPKKTKKTPISLRVILSCVGVMVDRRPIRLGEPLHCADAEVDSPSYVLLPQWASCSYLMEDPMDHHENNALIRIPVTKGRLGTFLGYD